MVWPSIWWHFGDWSTTWDLHCFNSSVVNQRADYSCGDCRPVCSPFALSSVPFFPQRSLELAGVPSPCGSRWLSPLSCRAVPRTCFCLFKVSARGGRCLNLLNSNLFSRILSKGGRGGGESIERRGSGLWVHFVQSLKDFLLLFWGFLWGFHSRFVGQSSVASLYSIIERFSSGSRLGISADELGRYHSMDKYC